MQIAITTHGGSGETILLPPELALNESEGKKNIPGVKLPGKHGKFLYPQLECLEPRILRASGTIKGLSIEDADELYHHYCNYLFGQGELWLKRYSNSNKFIKVKTTKINRNYHRGRFGGSLFTMTFIFEANDPFWYSEEVIEEMVVTPASYPTTINMTNPDPRANLKFGNYNIETGALITEENSWENNTTSIFTRTQGDGFEFTCVGGFSASVYCIDVVGRRIKIFVDDVFIEEILLENNPSDFVIIYNHSFDDLKEHKVKLIKSLGFEFNINYIYLIPSNISTLINQGTADSDVSMVIESTDTTSVFSALGKVTGDADHPFSAYSTNTPDPLAIDPVTRITYEFSQDWYDRVSFDNNSKTSGVYSSTAGYYRCEILHFNLKALQSSYYNMTLDEIRDYMQLILAEIWAYGVGVNNGQIENGVEMYVWTDGDHWSTSYRSNASNFPSKLTFLLDSEWNPARFEDDAGKVYILLKSTYPSDGVNPSAVYLDYCRLATTHNLCKLTGDIVINTVKNLVPPFTSSELTIAPDTKYIDDYELEINTTSTSNLVSYFDTPAKIGETFVIDCETNGKITLVPKDGSKQSTSQASVVTVDGQASITITASETKYLRVAFYNSGAGVFYFKKPILTPIAQPFQPQEKKVIGFKEGEEVTLTNGDTLTIDPSNYVLTKNNLNLLSSANESFLIEGYGIESGFNQFLINHIGSNLKMKLKYYPKYY